MTQELSNADAPPGADAVASAPVPVPARRRANRDIRLLWSACASDALGSNASGIVTPLLLLGLGYSAAVVGIVSSACAAAGLLLAPLVAWPADRGARKAVMFWSAVVSGLAMGVLALALAYGRPPLALILGALLLECLAAACYQAAVPGTAALLAVNDDIPRVVAGVEAGEQGALILGPALGGVLYQLARPLPFLLDAVSYAVTAVCVRSMRADLRPPQAPTSAEGDRRAISAPGDGGVRAGLRLVRSSPLLRLVLVWAAAVNGVLAALTYQVVIVLSRGGHGGVPMGMVLAVAGAAGLAGALVAPRLVARFGSGRSLVAATWLLVPPVAGLAAAGSVWVFGALFAFVCLLLPLMAVVLQSAVARAVPPGSQARVGAVLTVVAGSVAALAPALTGVLADRTGTAMVPTVCAAVLLLLALRTSVSGPRLLSSGGAA